jgi:hypothetical protein
MVRRLFGPIALLTVIGALAIAAVGYAANAATSKPSAPQSAPTYAPAAAHSKGNCPNMGGDSSAPSSPSSSSESEL